MLMPGLCRVTGAFLLALLAACSHPVNLQAGLGDADANEIVALLERHGITAGKQSGKDGVALSVDASEIARATAVMRAAGLPRRSLSDLGQVFKKDSMISTPLEERVRYLHGLSDELEATLQQFDHVIAARVHVVLPERIAPGEPIQPSSAAVFLKYVAPLDEDAVIPRVRGLVAASITGLADQEGGPKVSVVLEATSAAAPPPDWRDVGPFRVQSASATALGATLGVLGLLLLAALAALLWSLGCYHPRLAPLVRRYAGKPASRASAADAP